MIFDKPAAVSPRQWLAVGVGFIVLAAIVFAPSLRSFFHSDDFVLIDQIRRGGPLSLWTHAPSGFLRPLISLTLYADLCLYGLHPAGYHAGNILLHTLNALLVVALSRRFFSTRKANLLAVLTGLLFLLQPFHSESVCWISGRTDLVATFFFLATVLAYLRFRENRSRSALVLSLLLFVPALFSKESVTVLPLILLLWEAVPTSDESAAPKDRPWRAATAFFVLAVGFVILRRLLLGALIAGYGTNAYLSFGPRHLRDAALWFIAAVQLPILPREIGYLSVFAAEVALVAWRLRRSPDSDRHRSARVVILLAVSCAISILPVFTLAGGVASAVSGRLAYLPSVFGLPLLVLLADFVFGERRTATVSALIALAIVFAVQLRALSQRWFDAGELARHTIDSTLAQLPGGESVVLAVPDSYYPAYCLRNGLPEAVRLFDRARPEESITVASSVCLFSPGDTVDLHRVGSSTFDLTLHPVRPLTANASADLVFLPQQPPIVARRLGLTAWEIALPASIKTNRTILYYTKDGQMAPVLTR